MFKRSFLAELNVKRWFDRKTENKNSDIGDVFCTIMIHN